MRSGGVRPSRPYVCLGPAPPNDAAQTKTAPSHDAAWACGGSCHTA
ncbi:hypothetical protein SLI_7079 [Streptomyces lividans 1326]|uniref:Uncharacterized protein n=1 Tax=Streptomyces lividans 1326 TaxID=1200984 RepID=A0A7U9HFH9_STRLI|nr:hypothetical protein SLI_7079 [Streptomyces lividans 1326]